jgi:hypothetical protein
MCYHVGIIWWNKPTEWIAMLVVSQQDKLSTTKDYKARDLWIYHVIVPINPQYLSSSHLKFRLIKTGAEIASGHSMMLMKDA